MKNLLIKEIKLTLSPVNYLFLLFITMSLIPAYPGYVGFFYICLSIFFMFNNAELNKDIQYSMILPIRKSDMVKARCLLVGFYELVVLILSIPFGLLQNKLMPDGNPAGIDYNVAFYGFVLILYTAFHFVLFTKFYKKAEKPGLPFLFASICFWILYAIVEFPVWTKNVFDIKLAQILDSTAPENLFKQFPVLVIGILIYIAGWLATCRISSKRFEKVDL